MPKIPSNVPSSRSVLARGLFGKPVSLVLKAAPRMRRQMRRQTAKAPQLDPSLPVTLTEPMLEAAAVPIASP